MSAATKTITIISRSVTVSRRKLRSETCRRHRPDLVYVCARKHYALA